MSDLPPLPSEWDGMSRNGFASCWEAEYRIDGYWLARVRLYDDGTVSVLGADVSVTDLLAVLLNLQARAEQGGNDG